MGKLVIAALIVLPFIALILWDKDGSNDSSARDFVTAFMPKEKRIQEDIDATLKTITLVHVQKLAKEDPRIQEVVSRPKALSDIRKTVAALGRAEVRIVHWEKQGAPLLRSKTGARITWNPRFVAAAEKIFNDELPDKSEIEEPLAGLLPYIGEVRKMKGAESAPLVEYNPLKLSDLRETARAIAEKYEGATNAILGLEGASLDKEPGAFPDLQSAIETLRQTRAAAKILQEIQE